MNNIIDILKYFVEERFVGDENKYVQRVRINIHHFTDIITAACSLFPFDPITDRDTLMTGFYGSFEHINIFVNKSVRNNTIEISFNDEIIGNWSVPIPFSQINNYKKYVELAAFS